MCVGWETAELLLLQHVYNSRFGCGKLYLRFRPQATCFCTRACHAAYASCGRCSGPNLERQHLLIHFGLKFMKNGWVYAFGKSWKQKQSTNVIGFSANGAPHGCLSVSAGSFLKIYLHFKSSQDEVCIPQVYITDVPSHAPAKCARPA